MDDREIVYYNHNSFSPFRFRFKPAFVELYQKLLYNLLLSEFLIPRFWTKFRPNSIQKQSIN